jgi:hypothetical protein
LRSQVCTMNYELIKAFGKKQRIGEDETTVELAPYLVGRPWHPCDWRGLLSLEGWAQEVRHWAVKIGIPWDYKCGEKRALGEAGDSTASCEESRMPRTGVEFESGRERRTRGGSANSK